MMPKLGKSPGDLAEDMKTRRFGNGIGTTAGKAILGLHPRQARRRCRQAIEQHLRRNGPELLVQGIVHLS
jgi:hypothetical protein